MAAVGDPGAEGGAKRGEEGEGSDPSECGERRRLLGKRGKDGDDGGRYLLKKWLEYSAAKGKRGLDVPTNRGTDSPFEDYVIKQLKAIGCETHPQVGVSGYFIDIGVKQRDGQQDVPVRAADVDTPLCVLWIVDALHVGAPSLRPIEVAVDHCSEL